MQFSGTEVSGSRPPEAPRWSRGDLPCVPSILVPSLSLPVGTELCARPGEQRETYNRPCCQWVSAQPRRDAQRFLEMRQARTWGLGPSAAVLSPGQMSPQATKDRETTGD